MENQDQQQIVSGSSEFSAVVKEGRLMKHYLEEHLYEVTEHQLKLITLAASDMGFDFNVFVACGSVAVTILLALNTTQIKDLSILTWWRAGFILCVVLGILSFIRWLLRKSTFINTVAEIRNQRLCDPA